MAKTVQLPEIYTKRQLAAAEILVLLENINPQNEKISEHVSRTFEYVVYYHNERFYQFYYSQTLKIFELCKQ